MVLLEAAAGVVAAEDADANVSIMTAVLLVAFATVWCFDWLLHNDDLSKDR